MKGHVPAHRYACVQLQKLKGPKIQALQKAPYKWLSYHRGTYVVHFWVTGKLDHVVCVDGRRKLICDNEETHAFDLTADSLCFCVRLKTSKVEDRAMQMVK